MLDTHSDYALNKIDGEAIVCPCANGESIRLTREDFSSEEEFSRWKAWSDDDYHQRELVGRKDDDCLSFEAQRDTPAPSVEETIFASHTAAVLKEHWRRLLEKIKGRLTPMQYRRLCLHYIEELSVEEIADIEGVSTQAIYLLLGKARRIIVNNL